MDIENNHITLLYKDDIFYLNSKYLTLDTKLSYLDRLLKANIKSLVFKDFNLKLSGEFMGNIKTLEGEFKGVYKTHNIQGDLKLKTKQNILYYEANSKDFASLKPFMKALNRKIKLNPTINNWIYKKAVAKSYKIEYFRGRYNFKNGNFYPNDLNAKAYGKDVEIKFHKNAPPVYVKNVDIFLKNDVLSFKIQGANYQKLKIKKPHVYIKNLIGKGSYIVIDLKTNAPLNRDIHKILKAFNIYLPIMQTKGKTNSHVKMKMNFKPFTFDIKGDFKVKDVKFLLSNAPFKSKFAHIKLDNEKVLLKDTNLAYKDILNIDTDGVFNLNLNEYKGDTRINLIHIGMNNDKLLDIKDKSIKSYMYIKKDGIDIELPEFKAKMFFSKHKNHFTQDNLALLFKYSPFMKSKNLYDGKIKVDTEDFVNFDAFLRVKKMKPIFEKNRQPLSSMDLHVNIQKDKTKAISSDGCFKLSSFKEVNHINIDRCNILIDTNSSAVSSNIKAYIYGNKSNIILKDTNKTILLDNFQAEVSNSSLNFTAQYKKGYIEAKKDKNILHVKADNLNHTFVNSILEKKIFKGGNFNLKIKGANSEHFVGYVRFDDTFIKSFSTYNNLIAFLNTLPSLLSLKKPSFNQKGYLVKNANILFERKKRNFDIYSIDIKGVDADIIGKGKYDIENEFVDLKVDLKTFKDVSNLIGKIPLLNNILLGNNNTIEIFVSIAGKIDNPKVTTQTAKEAALVPFNIIKRTISLPFKIF